MKKEYMSFPNERHIKGIYVRKHGILYINLAAYSWATVYILSTQ